MDKEEFPFFVFFVFRNERNVEESAHLREQNYLVLDELHRTYGEYVRVGM